MFASHPNRRGPAFRCGTLLASAALAATAETSAPQPPRAAPPTYRDQVAGTATEPADAAFLRLGSGRGDRRRAGGGRGGLRRRARATVAHVGTGRAIGRAVVARTDEILAAD